MSLETHCRTFPVVRGRGEKDLYISGQRPHVSGGIRDTRHSVSRDTRGWPALKIGVAQASPGLCARVPRQEIEFSSVVSEIENTLAWSHRGCTVDQNGIGITGSKKKNEQYSPVDHSSSRTIT